MLRNLVLALAALFMGAMPASAATLIYTGQNYEYTLDGSNPAPGYTAPTESLHTLSDRITVTLQIDGDLAANLTNQELVLTDYVFSDGVSTIANNASYLLVLVTTDSDGNIIAWRFRAKAATDFPEAGSEISISSGARGEGGGIFDADGYRYSFGGISRPDMLGTWQVISGAVPEPATWLMLIMAFFAVGATMRARTARAKSGRRRVAA